MKFSRRSILGAAGAMVSVSLINGMISFSAAADAIEPSVSPKRIGVIGAGWLGGTVGSVWVKAGHQVMFSSRHPEELKSMTDKLGSRASVGTIGEAAEFGDVLLFAVPYAALPQLGRDLADLIRGKIVLDACNSSSSGSDALTREAHTNGDAMTTAKYLPGANVVRAFSAVDATAVEASASRAGNKLGVPIAGDDPQAVAVAAQLVTDAGCVPVVVGKLADATSFQRGGPGFRANTDSAKLRRLLNLPAVVQ